MNIAKNKKPAKIVIHKELMVSIWHFIFTIGAVLAGSFIAGFQLAMQ